ncbi:MAG: DinB family protein [Thermanaerothrix sp.]|uniref:DinB family protein n=1 Tax=Thermanaerothrix sp. TaxID=2972675 RepID=UPI003C7BA010
MTLTILIDLDDTLLINNANLFQEIYLKALAEHLKAYIPPEKLISQLLSATRAMYKKKTPQGTLKETFDAHFYPALGVSPSLLQPLIDEFYTQIFPTLSCYTQPRLEAIDLIQTALSHGHRVVIATNPLFPRVAILERLRWANLPPDTYPFTLIPDYETFHFCKPHPAFLAEILATLRWPEDPAVMIGNSLDEDILPAEALGLPTYWVNETFQFPTDQRHPLSSQGPLSGVGAWLSTIEDNTGGIELKTPAAILAILAATPAAIENLTRDLPPVLWMVRPAPQEWAVNEIICHLRDVDAEVNLPRLSAILSSDNPFIAGIDTDNWAEARNYHAQDGTEALRSFMATRMLILNQLEPLTPNDWQRTARHAIFGHTSLQELMGFVATHDQTHIRQIGNTIYQVRMSPSD